MSDFSERLRTARGAMDLTQDAMAARVAIPKRSYCAYEAGETVPSAKLLTALAQIGIDVGFLLTGKRSGADGLAHDAALLLSDYSACDPRDKETLRVLARGLRVKNESQANNGAAQA